ncbi:hypothetical protein OQA88_3054 [Cercophora sp. LCS_1]
MFVSKTLLALAAIIPFLCGPALASPVGPVYPNVEVITYACRFCGTKLCPAGSATRWTLEKIETDKCHLFRSETEMGEIISGHAFSDLNIKKGCEITFFGDAQCDKESWQYTADYKFHGCFERAGGYNGLKAFKVSCS